MFIGQKEIRQADTDGQTDRKREGQSDGLKNIRTKTEREVEGRRQKETKIWRQQLDR
jgi:hypothetical protein